jgi:hypothetical protein
VPIPPKSEGRKAQSPAGSEAGETKVVPAEAPFQPGTMVLATLGNPREKFWGAILVLAPAGISLRGIHLQSFDNCAAMVKAGEPFAPTVVFFPLHRVERVELDAPSGDIPSLTQQFLAKSGCDPAPLFAPDPASSAGGEV